MRPIAATISSLIPLVTLFIATPALAQSTEPGSLKTGTAGEWIIHQNAGDGPKTCFAATLPKLKEPAGANRSKVVLYVSAWPKDGVKSEVSVKLGYKVKPDSPVAVTVGDEAFQLFGDEDRAYVADAADEAKLVDAMKKGSQLVVKATSTRGTETTDTYALNGFGPALDAVASACP